MNRLGRGAAKRCEEAAEPECRCRCGGALHGAKRGPTDTLPLTDPHSTKRDKCRYGSWYACRGPAVTEREGLPLCKVHAEADLTETLERLRR